MYSNSFSDGMPGAAQTMKDPCGFDFIILTSYAGISFSILSELFNRNFKLRSTETMV